MSRLVWYQPSIIFIVFITKLQNLIIDTYKEIRSDKIRNKIKKKKFTHNIADTTMRLKKTQLPEQHPLP